MSLGEITKEIVIVGLGVGGLYASKAATSTDRKAHVTIIEKRDFDMFSPCGMPFALKGMVKDFDELKHTVPSTRQVSKYLSHELLSISPEEKNILLQNNVNGEEFSISYGSLVLALGAEPVNLPIPGADDFYGRGFHFMSDLDDAKKLYAAALASKKKTAVVVGGGAIGLEIAVALRTMGLAVHVTKRTPPPLPRDLDPKMGTFIIEKLDELGIKNYFGKGIDRINGKEWIESVEIAGETIPCDIVVMAVGMRPRVQQAEECGIIVNRNGIVTDERMETSIPGIFAIGDCVESFSRIDGSRASMRLATSAYRMGTIAGTNAAGGTARYRGVGNTFVSMVGNLEISATGYNLETAEKAGFSNAKGIMTKGLIKPHWMPGATRLVLRIVADGNDGRILGAQAIGEQGAAWRINVLALAISAGLTVHDIADAEFSYCPPVSDVYDPLSQIAEIAIKRLKLNRPGR